MPASSIAIAAALRTKRHLPDEYNILKVGIGVGKKVFPHANILRAMIIEPASADREDIWMLESNIDDCSGEELGFAMEQLLKAGAVDVHFMPCFMKKNRPGYLLRVMVRGELLETMENLIFTHTSTIGIRKTPLVRSRMKRENIDVKTPYGTISVKKCSWGDMVKFYPEYESVRSAAENSGAGFRTVFESASAAAAHGE